MLLYREQKIVLERRKQPDEFIDALIRFIRVVGCRAIPPSFCVGDRATE
jgi:hypothetical protein